MFRRNPGKIVIHQCNGNPPVPDEVDPDSLVPPSIDFKNLKLRKPLVEDQEKGHTVEESDSEESNSDEFDRETCIRFCKGMIRNLPEGPSQKFFQNLYQNLQFKKQT